MHLSDHIIHVELVGLVVLKAAAVEGEKIENYHCTWHCPMENVWGGVGNGGQLYALFNLSTRRSGV